jgi:electron-transferring-flavoprotein dehydrogenase
MCSGQAITLGDDGAPTFKREKCVLRRLPVNCAHAPDGEHSNIRFTAGAGGLHSGES